MENEVHNEHEHASVSLKVILLVFAVILVGALGYFVWDYQNTPDTTDYSTPKITKTETEEKEETKEVIAANNVYKDAEATFSFDIPEGYFITEYKDVPSSAGWIYALTLVENSSSEGVLTVLPIKISRGQQGAPAVHPTLDEAKNSLVETLGILDPDRLENEKEFTNENGVKMKSFEGGVFGGKAYGTVATDPQNHFSIYRQNFSRD